MSRSYLLPGGRIGVASASQLPRAAVAASWLLGPPAAAIRWAARSRRPEIAHALERRWARQAVRLLGIQLDMVGLDRVDRAGRYVVAPLHEGFADPVALLHLPLGLRFVARHELLDWAHLGSYLEASRQVILDPERPVASYRALLRSAPDVLAGGDSLVVFPQGSILGIETAFTRGAFRLADRLEVPLLPVVLSGSHRVWEYPYRPTLRFGQRMRMEVLEPLPVGTASRSMEALQCEMKTRALSAAPSPRRFNPDVDGWWDDYRYDIDPAFPELAGRVAEHRRRAAGSTEVETACT